MQAQALVNATQPNLGVTVKPLQAKMDGAEAALELMYTETDKDALVAQAVAQAEEEQAIVLMETEDLRKQLAFQVEQNSQLTACMDEYSKEITRLMDGKDANVAGDSKRAKELELERDQVQEDLEKTETAFADLHSKYGKVKEVVDNFKKNEKILKEALIQAQEATKAAESRYDALRAHAEGKIAEANAEIAQVRESNSAQIVALTMKVKTAEREVASLTRQIEAKDTDNAELTQICTELVTKLEQAGGSA